MIIDFTYSAKNGVERFYADLRVRADHVPATGDYYGVFERWFLTVESRAWRPDMQSVLVKLVDNDYSESMPWADRKEMFIGWKVAVDPA